MRHFHLSGISKFSLMVFLIAGIAGANMTERMEGRFLKSRIKLSFDEDWKVQSGTITGAEVITYSDASWTSTNVPHDLAITLIKPTGTSGNDPAVRGWYRKHFTLPAELAGKKVIVVFDGIYHDSKIYLNGTQVGAQQYGYTNFYCDLTANLNATGDNVLAVSVDDQTVRNSRWYSGCGIYRHVWLIATDKVYVRHWGTAVTTPTATATSPQIRVQTDVVNDLTTAQSRDVETTIYDEGGNPLQTVTTTITVNPKSTDSTKNIDTCVQIFNLTSCKLWSTSTPVLYYAYTRLLSTTTATDDYVTPFGIRDLKFTPGTGMTVNGVPTKMKGACFHENLVPVGAAIPDGMFERTIKELKAAGCSSIRTSHNPQSQEFYDLCDQIGMMVLDEWCDKWYQQAGGAAGILYENWDQTWKHDLKLMVERDRNHPSVVMWSGGNEMYYGATIPAYITDNMSLIVPWVHTFDKTARPVTSAPNVQDAAGYVNLAKIQDNVAGINYGEGIYASIHSQGPNVLIQGTESSRYLSGSSPTYFWVRDNAYIVGHHIWTGVDYLGEGPTLGSQSGYLDGCGFRKATFYYMQAQWSDSPMVHVAIGNGMANNGSALTENWNQAAGSLDTVVTYTNCDSVDLYVNTTKIGTKKLSDFSSNWIMQWTNVPWSSGTIKAIGMKGGRQAAIDSINTAGAAAKVVLKPDHTTLYADGHDVSCIEVDIEDASNNLVFSATNTVSFTMTGPGRNLGIASGNWTSAEPFKATSRAAYHGKALIVIQSTLEPGTINLTINSGTMTPASLTLTTVTQQVNTIKPVAPSVSALGEGARLFTCTQNPVNKNIRVRYRVDIPERINLSVVSPSGRMVKCLTNNYQPAGIYSIDWNATTRSGVYFFVLKTNGNRIVKKAFIVE